MSDDLNNNARPAAWQVILIIVCALPVLAMPWLTALIREQTPERTLLWFYPAYVIASAICAYICFPRRPEVSWILLVLMLLTHAAMWLPVILPY